MRLLNVETLQFTEFHDHDRPKYVVASHRWVNGFEASFKDVKERRNTDGLGYKKVAAFARYVRQNITEVQWLWIDTCCINKESEAELSEAINLMFQWYRDSELCLAYLADVETVDDKSSFAKSEWFNRGWTLQELLAPQTVIFVTKTWQVVGNKGGSAHGDGKLSTGLDIGNDIAAITGIPLHVLRDYSTSSSLSVDERLRWMEGRATSREEDMSYALYGIFNVTPGANYGERHQGARRRLMEAIYQPSEQFRKVVDWLSPPDPWSNHDHARQRHEKQTGEWFLQHNQYQEWRDGVVRHVWLYGKAGCGKTVLCSTAVEDVQSHRQADTGYAVFYFSFSDDRKQTCDNLLRSLVAQLAWKDPALSMLRQAYDTGDRIGANGLKKILLYSIRAFDRVYLMLDALDECPEANDVRQNVLKQLEELAQLPQLHILVTSREVSDIQESMEALRVSQIAIPTSATDADINRYVSSELSRHRKLRGLGPQIRAEIIESIGQNSDGMFRWAYCQLQELKTLKDFRPSYIRKALHNLPATLDETYTRMLTAIEDDYRAHALTLLRWIAYARSPPTLGQLVEAVVIDPENDSTDFDDRGDLEGTLNILNGLVTVMTSYNDRDAGKDLSHDDGGDISNEDESDISNEDENNISNDDRSNISNATDEDDNVRRIASDTRVRLAHFSVKEYLESSRILQSDAKNFHLNPATGHRFIAQSCLTYLTHYSGHDQKTATTKDLNTFPLLLYAARSWFHHTLKQQHEEVDRDVRLLSSDQLRRDWLEVYNAEIPHEGPFRRLRPRTPAGLYYASLLGLNATVKKLVANGANVNARGGLYGNSLQAASARGQQETVRLLLDIGANASAREGVFGNALQAACAGGNEEMAKLLLDSGAYVNDQGGLCGNSLTAASTFGFPKVVQMLLEAGADVNARADADRDTALYSASAHGHHEVVRLLLKAGADVNAVGGYGGTALAAASYWDHQEIVDTLRDAGAQNV